MTGGSMIYIAEWGRRGWVPVKGDDNHRQCMSSATQHGRHMNGATSRNQRMNGATHRNNMSSATKKNHTVIESPLKPPLRFVLWDLILQHLTV